MKKIIQYWYDQLDFPKEYHEPFQKALASTPLPPDLSAETYDFKSKEGVVNLLAFLYFCEGLKDQYEKRGIPREILLDTLNDIPRWCKVWSNLHGSLFLRETEWLSYHIRGLLFQLGRLQFAMGKAPKDYPDFGIRSGDDLMEMHIPATGEPMTPEACARSIEFAKEFFAEYYPEFKPVAITCHTWLLDEGLKNLLREGSNILEFQKLFQIAEYHESDAVLRYVFPWRTDREKLAALTAPEGFPARVKAHAEQGGKFYENLGIILL